MWEIERELARGERVYVVLQPNQSKIHEPIRVTEDKPNADANEVIFPGRYKYKGELEKKHYVEYDIERIDNYEEQYQLSDNKRAIVTVKIAPWGQKAIVGMEEE
ncbi:GDYXXLXY domain-containing protein [Oceanobacillus sp. FSL H7-0719]|uniref:GDYXXLXY domain-containing protein n=1 Tax=Oceanobacillus sp. FSL H7-0719 TaxID=2954507 RepID=UPI003245E788